MAAAPLPPHVKVVGLSGWDSFLPCAAACARVRANIEIGGRGTQLLQKHFPVMFSHPWTPKNELVRCSWARLHPGCAHNGCFCVTCDDRFWSPSHSTAATCLTQPLGTERRPRLGRRPPAHLAVSFLECPYLCRRGAAAATTMCISQSSRKQHRGSLLLARGAVGACEAACVLRAVAGLLARARCRGHTRIHLLGVQGWIE